MDKVVLVRSGGDIASGIIQKLHRAGFKVVVTELPDPSFIRRKVCYGSAVTEGSVELEGIEAVLVRNLNEMEAAFKAGKIPVFIDPEGKMIPEIQPAAVVDAILAKRNLGTTKDMAPITIGVGPGFCAGKDVDIVIETNRGHDLGRLIFQGEAEKNTGVPGEIKGYSKERVIYSPCEGNIRNIKEIGDIVEAGEIIAAVGEKAVKTDIAGVLRGIIRNGYPVYEGLKIADVDPRLDEQKNCFTISDKARNIGGGVLEALLYLLNRRA